MSKKHYYTHDESLDSADVIKMTDKQLAKYIEDYNSDTDNDFIITGTQRATGDCWIKLYSRPTRETLRRIAKQNGVSSTDISVCRPGTHPGGNAYWLSIYVEKFIFQEKNASI